MKELLQIAIRYALNSIYKVSKRVIPINLTKEILVQVVQENKDEIKELIDTLSANSSSVKNKFEVNFNLLFRAFITLVLLNTSVPNMNYLLLFSSISILIICMYFLVKAFHIVEVAPTFLMKLYQGVLSHNIIGNELGEKPLIEKQNL